MQPFSATFSAKLFAQFEQIGLALGVGERTLKFADRDIERSEVMTRVGTLGSILLNEHLLDVAVRLALLGHKGEPSRGTVGVKIIAAVDAMVEMELDIVGTDVPVVLAGVCVQNYKIPSTRANNPYFFLVD